MKKSFWQKFCIDHSFKMRGCNLHLVKAYKSVWFLKMWDTNYETHCNFVPAHHLNITWISFNKFPQLYLRCDIHLTAVLSFWKTVRHQKESNPTKYWPFGNQKRLPFQYRCDPRDSFGLCVWQDQTKIWHAKKMCSNGRPKTGKMYLVHSWYDQGPHQNLKKPKEYLKLFFLFCLILPIWFT